MEHHEKDDGAPGSAPQDGTTTPATVGDVLDAIEELWPARLAEGWDAVGPVVGRREHTAAKILLAVDPTAAVIEEALALGASMIVSHHPLLLKPVTSVAATGFKGLAVHRLIEARCALVTVHTNGDSAMGGVSDVLARVLGLDAVRPLSPTAGGTLQEGIGRVGDLDRPLTLGALAERVAAVLPPVAGGIRVAGERDALVRRIAVCGGAGDSLFDAVRASGADVYVTADLRHHPASEAREAAGDGPPYLIDVSHYASESLWLAPAAVALGARLAERGLSADIRVSEVSTDPWDFVLRPRR